MGDVGEQIRQHECFDELQPERLRPDGLLERRAEHPAEQERRGDHREEHADLDAHVAHEEVAEVGLPALAEDALFASGKHPLQRHEEERQEEEVQNEPVEPDVRALVLDRADRNLGAAEQCREHREPHPGHSEGARPAVEDGVEDAEGERHRQHELDQRANEIHRINGAHVRRGEPVRIAQTQDGAEAEGA